MSTLERAKIMVVAGSLTYETKIDKNGFNKDLNSLEKGVSNAGSRIKSIIVALGIDKIISTAFNVLNSSIDDAISRLDTLNNYPKVMSNLGVATDDAQKSIDKMSDKLAGLPTTLDEGAMAVQRFTSKNSDVAKSTDYFLALNNALLAGGAATDIQSTALEQLSQAYAKGKPDMMEWRSLQTAMPAQLNQVAKAFNMTSDEMGEALRSGELSMDDFMDKIVELNEKGIDGFQSFEEQAKNSTGGIQTSITVAKTQVVKGMADIIKSFDEALKNKGLGGISDIISNIGKKAKEVLDLVAKNIPKIIALITNVFNVFKKLLPVIISITTAFIAYKATLIAITAINFIKNIVGTVSAFLSLIPAIKSAKDAMLLLNMAMNANPVGVVIAGITALSTALIYFATKQSEAQKKAKEFAEEMSNKKQELEDYNKSIDDATQANLAHINSVSILKDELKTLVDENGNVKEGYESRVDFILHELNEALDTEYKLNGNLIEGYQNLQGEIDTLIEKKRAEIELSASEEKYKKAKEEEEAAVNDLNEAYNNLGMSIEDAQSELDKYHTAMDVYTGKVKDRMSLTKEEAEILNKYSSIWGKKTLETLEQNVSAYRDAESRIKTCIDNQKNYEEKYSLFVQGKYGKISSVIIDTTNNWCNSSLNEIKNSITEQSKELKNYEAIYKKYGTEIALQQAQQASSNLENLRNELIQRTSTVSELGQDEIDAWKELAQSSFNEYSIGISQMAPEMQEKIEDATGAIAAKTPEARDAAARLSQAVKKALDSEVDGEKWGADLSANIASGILSNGKTVSEAASSIASSVKKLLGHSVPEEGPLKDELTYMPDMIENLVKGINNNKYKVTKATEQLANEMADKLNLDALNDSIIAKMNKAVASETASIVATASVKSNNSMLNIIQARFDIDGSLNIDGRKAGQILTPHITKNLKLGGAR